MTAAILSPPASRSSREKECAIRSSVSAKVRTPQPSTAVATSDTEHLGGGRDLRETSCWSGCEREAVALRRPATGAAHGQEAGVLARAVVREQARAAAFLRPELEVVLGRRRLREQARSSSELRRLRPMRRARDRELLLRQVVPLARERQRLDRLGRRSEEGDELGIPGRRRRHDRPSTATACTRCTASTTDPRRTVTLSGSMRRSVRA